jgi:hypothetical protein
VPGKGGVAFGKAGTMYTSKTIPDLSLHADEVMAVTDKPPEGLVRSVDGSLYYWSYGVVGKDIHMKDLAVRFRPSDEYKEKGGYQTQQDVLDDWAKKHGFGSWGEARDQGFWTATDEREEGGEGDKFRSRANIHVINTNVAEPPKRVAEPVAADKYGMRDVGQEVGKLSDDKVKQAILKEHNMSGAIVDGWYEGKDSNKLLSQMDNVMAGTADRNIVDGVSKLYAYNQQVLERDFPGQGEFNLNRGITLDANDSRAGAMIEIIKSKGAVDLGTIGHWSTKMDVAMKFAKEGVDEGADVAVRFHRTFPKESILSCYKDSFTPYKPEEEFVPISTGTHRVSSYKSNMRKVSGRKIRFYDVYLE